MKKNFLTGLAGSSMLMRSAHTANRYMNADDLENEAAGLSNFGGRGYGYNGAGDDFLDFAGPAASFVEAGRESRPFIVSLTNASSSASRIVKLSPGLIANATGLMATGAFNDKNGASGLSGSSGSPGSIELFNAFVHENPSLVSGFKIACSNVSQMDQSLTIVKESPFKAHSSLVIPIGTYASEQNFNTAILSIPKPFFIDSQTVIEYTILPSTTVTITLMIGVSLNIAKALRDKTATAKTNIEAAQGSRFIG